MPRKGSPVSRAANPAETIWLSRSPESTASTPPGGRPAFSMLFSTAQSSILRSARSNVLSPNISSVSARSTYSRARPRTPSARRPPPTRRSSGGFQKYRLSLLHIPLRRRPQSGANFSPRGAAERAASAPCGVNFLSLPIVFAMRRSFIAREGRYSNGRAPLYEA